MAKPISYGVILEGEDARDFEEYQKNPTFTAEGIELMREALRRQREAEKAGASLLWTVLLLRMKKENRWVWVCFMWVGLVGG